MCNSLKLIGIMLVGLVVLVPPSQAQECQEISVGVHDFYQEIVGPESATLVAGRAVRSPQSYHGQPVTFVSFEVNGADYEGPGNIATWVTFEEMPTLANPVLSMAVRGLAHRLSVYGPAGNAEMMNPSHPDVTRSQNCVRQAVTAGRTATPQPRDMRRSGYKGPYDPNGPDRDCGDFDTQSEAQAFFGAAGGPERDLHRLDGDSDGMACESVPGELYDTAFQLSGTRLKG